MTRDIKITPVLNGWVVRVGCQQVVFTDLHYMASEIERYYIYPGPVEAEYRSHALNKIECDMPLSATEASDPAPSPPQYDPNLAVEAMARGST